MHDSLPILEEIVALLETEEEEIIGSEIKNRRMRLNAPPVEEIEREVWRQVYASSQVRFFLRHLLDFKRFYHHVWQLPKFYNEVMSHPNAPDQLRHDTESKLLRHKRQYLTALPTTGNQAKLKKMLAAEVQELISGMVLLQIPDELAWLLFIDGRDCETIGKMIMALLLKDSSLT